MPRKPRNDYPGAISHVMNRGSRRQATFLVDSDYRSFLGLLAKVATDFDVDVLSFCLMGNHYHLLVRSNTGQISEAMQVLGGRYTGYYNESHGLDGPLFRGRFHSVPVTSDRQLVAASRYIHRNPLPGVPLHRLEHHPWSSFRHYVLGGGPKWLVQDPVLDLFGGNHNLYRDFVVEPLSGDTTNETDWAQSLPIRLGESMSLSEARLSVIQAVASATGIEAAVLERSGPRDRSVALKMLIHLSRVVLEIPAAEVADRFGLSSRSSVYAATRALVDRAADDPEVAHQLEAAIRHLQTAQGV